MNADKNSCVFSSAFIAVYSVFGYYSKSKTRQPSREVTDLGDTILLRLFGRCFRMQSRSAQAISPMPLSFPTIEFVGRNPLVRGRRPRRPVCAGMRLIAL